MNLTNFKNSFPFTFLKFAFNLAKISMHTSSLPITFIGFMGGGRGGWMKVTLAFDFVHQTEQYCLILSVMLLLIEL